MLFAPTSAVVPSLDTATYGPREIGDDCDRVNTARCAQRWCTRPNTHAAVRPPISAVLPSPDRATLSPRPYSRGAFDPSLGVSALPCCIHPCRERTNTQAAPLEQHVPA